MTLGLPAPVTFILSAAILAVVGLVEERVAIRPLSGRGLHGELVTTVGVAVIIEGVLVKVWGPDPLRVPFAGPAGTWHLAGTPITPVEVVLVAVAVAAAVGLHLWGRLSRAGLASRANVEDREAAMLRGVNVRRLSMGAFVAAGAFAGLLGPVVGPETFAAATLGLALALKGFVALALGGFGSQLGALVGGMTLGLVEAVGSRQLGASYQNLIIFGVLVVVLLVRPTGLFGRRGERVV